MNSFRNIIYLILACLALQYIAGWLGPLFLCLLTSGYVFQEHIVSKTGLIGLILNGYDVVYIYVMYPKATDKILGDLSGILAGIDSTLVLLISLIIPTILFSIAGFISGHGTYIYKKLKA